VVPKCAGNSEAVDGASARVILSLRRITHSTSEMLRRLSMTRIRACGQGSWHHFQSRPFKNLLVLRRETLSSRRQRSRATFRSRCINSFPLRRARPGRRRGRFRRALSRCATPEDIRVATGIPRFRKWRSMASLCSSRRLFSVPCATGHDVDVVEIRAGFPPVAMGQNVVAGQPRLRPRSPCRRARPNGRAR